MEKAVNLLSSHNTTFTSQGPFSTRRGSSLGSAILEASKELLSPARLILFTGQITFLLDNNSVTALTENHAERVLKVYVGMMS